MRLCITAQGNDPHAMVDPRFGRCRYFWIIDTVSGQQEILENSNVQNSGGAGIQSAQFIVSKGVEAILTGNVGPNATQILNPAGIKIHTGIIGRVTDVINDLKNGVLKTA